MSDQDLTTEDRLLALVPRLVRGDREIEREATLPQGWLAKARAGSRRGPQARASWSALAAYLARRLGSETLRGIVGSVESVSPVESLAAALDGATTAEALEVASRALPGLVVRGLLSEARAAVVRDLLRERRVLVEAAQAERSRATEGRVELVVRYVDDWRAT